ECVRTLSAALRAKAVTLEVEGVDACARAMAQAHEGCGWVGPFPPELPVACRGLVRGALEKGARCRSSLECRDGMRCSGAGPTAAGRCAPPRADGESCGTAVDTLATYTRDADLDARHPECQGHCARFRCAPRVTAGSACTQT